MDRNSFDEEEEEVSEDELKSVALTMASFIVIIICATSWILLT